MTNEVGLRLILATLVIIEHESFQDWPEEETDRIPFETMKEVVAGGRAVSS